MTVQVSDQGRLHRLGYPHPENIQNPSWLAYLLSLPHYLAFLLCSTDLFTFAPSDLWPVLMDPECLHDAGYQRFWQALESSREHTRYCAGVQLEPTAREPYPILLSDRLVLSAVVMESIKETFPEPFLLIHSNEKDVGRSPGTSRKGTRRPGMSHFE